MKNDSSVVAITSGTPTVMGFTAVSYTHLDVYKRQVKQSGKFEGTKVQMSKRGSAIARRVIHTLTLRCV